VNQGCREAIAQVYPYIDGEMTWLRRRRVTWHLRKCKPCRCAFEFEDKLKRVIRERTGEVPPPELIDRLRAFLRENGVAQG
jgi:mycothiol system anti-sigma-R factor